MFYSTIWAAPIVAPLAIRYFGINPDTQPEAARAAGIYPLIQAPEGYTPIAYVKEGNAYRAIPREFSDAQHRSISRILERDLKLQEAAEKLTEAPVTADEEEEPKPKRRRRKAD